MSDKHRRGQLDQIGLLDTAHVGVQQIGLLDTVYVDVHSVIQKPCDPIRDSKGVSHESLQ